MKYNHIKEAVFLNRPNRFIANIIVDGKEEVSHVKNTGRCAELLTNHAQIYVQEHDDAKRKTKFSLIAVNKAGTLINMDSQAPNQVVKEWLFAGGLFPDVTLVKPETKYMDSRFDFYVETPTKKVFIEVKCVTLEVDGIARFPDAPTSRGVKHIEELCQSVKEGYEAYIIFVIQMKGIIQFEPNYMRQEEFGFALEAARDQGVHILAYDCIVTQDTLVLDQEVPVKLGV